MFVLNSGQSLLLFIERSSHMLAIITLALYVLGALTQTSASFQDRKSLSQISLFLGFLAITCHSLLLYHWVDLGPGQNLNDFNLFSLATWLTAILILVISAIRPAAYLNIIIYPLTALSILLAAQSPAHHILNTANNPPQLFHIFLSILTFSVLSLAGVQAITLAFQEQLLRRKWVTASFVLPSIESMERFLFEMIALGALLLSLVLVTSLIFFHSLLLHAFLEKTILTSSAWLVFLGLLIGRYRFGWRGKKAIYCTLCGVAILTLTYFSSMLIMGLIS